MDPIQRIKQANELKDSKALELQRHADMTTAFIGVQETILKSFTSLVNYLDNKVTKAEVINQLKEVGTPDALKVVESVNNLHETLKTHKDTDLSGVVEIMSKILAEAEKIPKEIPEEKEQKFIDYSDQFESFITAINAVETVVKEQKLIAEAPIVNVPETNVNVEAPDLKPLQKGLKDVVSAVNKIVIPEYKTDNKGVEKLLGASNKLLKQLLDKPVGGGGGGGGRATPYQDATGIPAFVSLTAGGEVPVAIGSPVEVFGTVSSTAPEGGATEENQVDQTDILNQILVASQALAAARGIASDIRVTLLGGTTAVTGTLTAVTTVSTVSNLASVGGLTATTLVPSNQNTAAVLSNINNVV